MKYLKLTSYFNIFIGFSMMIMWLFFIIFDMVPEFEEAPFEIATHLVAEFLTAITLVVSGVFLIKKLNGANILYYLSYGLLLYAVINSLGYFLDPFDIAMTSLFTLILIISSTLFVQNSKS
ncbi:MAG: hypothetical protein RG740_04915, partial [Acholeplasmataceae bacterium]|nr:hypothetical protein [Acholeplasmataceae bacterium]